MTSIGLGQIRIIYYPLFISVKHVIRIKKQPVSSKNKPISEQHENWRNLNSTEIISIFCLGNWDTLYSSFSQKDGIYMHVYVGEIITL